MDAKKKGNVKGGKKYKKTKTKTVRTNFDPYTRDVIERGIKDGDLEYAQVESFAGEKRVNLITKNNEHQQGIMMGRLKQKKQWVQKESIVLINKDNEVLKIIQPLDTCYREAQEYLKIVLNNPENINISGDKPIYTTDDCGFAFSDL